MSTEQFTGDVLTASETAADYARRQLASEHFWTSIAAIFLAVYLTMSGQIPIAHVEIALGTVLGLRQWKHAQEGK